ncbi:MAG: aromatic amino acid lyase [Fibrella sp.]|nr:aromatic amino acid lyase [Armatimonadota bacterium]
MNSPPSIHVGYSDVANRPDTSPAPDTTLWLGPDRQLTCEAVEKVASVPNHAAVDFTPVAQEAMLSSYGRLRRLQAAGTPLYGTTTGFGPFVQFTSNGEGDEKGGHEHGAGLIAHLGAGWGPVGEPWTSADVVRAVMLVRTNTLAQGMSGIRPGVAERYLNMLTGGIVPCVPPVGSVGASGDLIPLAHIARVLTGDGPVFYKGRIVPSTDALAAIGIAPLALEGRDALALTNGTAFLSGIAALAVARAERLTRCAERLTGWMYATLGARADALDPRLHAARGHAGQKTSARHIREETIAIARGDNWEDATRPLQEIYSLRCAPQILGACRENLDHARRLVETEINGVTDNPLLLEDSEASLSAVALHGGNFQGQQVAFAADALNAALVQMAVLAERQIDALVSPSRTNDNAPLLLSWRPGAFSGLAGAQITATALVAEMRAHCHAHATYSIPTNGGNQDVVSMGTLAARMALAQTERLAAVLAVLAMALAQLTFLREEGLAAGHAVCLPVWMPRFEPIREDRAVYTDIQRLSAVFLHKN